MLWGEISFNKKIEWYNAKWTPLFIAGVARFRYIFFGFFKLVHDDSSNIIVNGDEEEDGDRRDVTGGTSQIITRPLGQLYYEIYQGNPILKDIVSNSYYNILLLFTIFIIILTTVF